MCFTVDGDLDSTDAISCPALSVHVAMQKSQETKRLYTYLYHALYRCL
jgi:hypothetical protein